MKYLILLSLLIVGCKDNTGSASFSDTLIGTELSDTECRKVNDNPLLFAISGQTYGVQVYETQVACDVNAATWLDMGFLNTQYDDFEPQGYPNLVLKLSYIDGVAYLDVYEE